MNKIIIIGGATASGKTAFGVETAKMLDTSVISCDSMQIYKYMNIGTAKVSDEETQGVCHYMVDIANPQDEFSVGEYSIQAKKHIDSIIAQGKIPVIVGGTGLYIDSILYSFSFGGEKDEKLRRELEDQLEKFGKDYMYDKLKEIDIEDAKKIHPNNTKRVIRALEIYYSTGKNKSQMNNSEKTLLYEPCMVVLNPDRKKLYERINRRVDIMFEKGLEEEVKNLLDINVGFDKQSMQAIGYKEFKDYFEKKISKNELIEKIKQNSRNYAKRQLTWLKRYDFAKWFDPTSQHDECIEYIKDFCKGANNEI